jgi:uncharacterized protein
MKLNGTQVIPASRERVWNGLNDPVILQQCIPGCSKIEVLSSTEFKATVTIAVGPVKANFAGEVTLSDLNPPESYRISGKGNGGFVGFATGGADIRLTALSANETQMDYDVDAQIGGKLAMLGSRLIDSTATSLAEKFFTKFGSLIKADAANAPAASSSTAKPKAPAKKLAAKKPAQKKAVKAVKKPAANKVAKAVKKAVAKKAVKTAKKSAKPIKKLAAKKSVKKPVKKKAKK